MKTNDIMIFDEFIKMCPWAEKDVVRWYPSDFSEIISEMRDGSVIQYDQIYKTFRCAHSLDELKDKRTPHNQEEWKKEFAWRLYRKMVSKGYTQEDLAFDSDIAESSISYYVNGSRIPTTYNMARIAKVLHLTGDDLAKILCLT